MYTFTRPRAPAWSACFYISKKTSDEFRTQQSKVAGIGSESAEASGASEEESFLNELGQKGWELTSVVHIDMGVDEKFKKTMYFKRMVK